MWNKIKKMIHFAKDKLMTEFLDIGDIIYGTIISNHIYISTTGGISSFCCDTPPKPLKVNPSIKELKVLNKAKNVFILEDRDKIRYLYSPVLNFGQSDYNLYTNFVFCTKEEYEKELEFIRVNKETVEKQKILYPYLEDTYTSSSITGEPIENLLEYYKIGSKFFTLQYPANEVIFGRETGLYVDGRKLYVSLSEVFIEMCDKYVKQHAL